LRRDRHQPAVHSSQQFSSRHRGEPDRGSRPTRVDAELFGARTVTCRRRRRAPRLVAPSFRVEGERAGRVKLRVSRPAIRNSRMNAMKTKLLIATCLALQLYGWTLPSLVQSETVEFTSDSYPVAAF